MSIIRAECNTKSGFGSKTVREWCARGGKRGARRRPPRSMARAPLRPAGTNHGTGARRASALGAREHRPRCSGYPRWRGCSVWVGRRWRRAKGSRGRALGPPRTLAGSGAFRVGARTTRPRYPVLAPGPLDNGSGDDTEGSRGARAANIKQPLRAAMRMRPMAGGRDRGPGRFR
jgi:hypothetical protein